MLAAQLAVLDEMCTAAEEKQRPPPTLVMSFPQRQQLLKLFLEGEVESDTCEAAMPTIWV